MSTRTCLRKQNSKPYYISIVVLEQRFTMRYARPAADDSCDTLHDTLSMATTRIADVRGCMQLSENGLHN